MFLHDTSVVVACSFSTRSDGFCVDWCAMVVFLTGGSQPEVRRARGIRSGGGRADPFRRVPAVSTPACPPTHPTERGGDKPGKAATQRGCPFEKTDRQLVTGEINLNRNRGWSPQDRPTGGLTFNATLRRASSGCFGPLFGASVSILFRRLQRWDPANRRRCPTLRECLRSQPAELDPR